MSKISIEDIQKAVIEVISESLGLGVEEITKESSLNELNIDSLSLIGILIDIEDKFEIEIPDEEAEKFQTVEDVIEYIKKSSS